jgi:hypothetical protein
MRRLRRILAIATLAAGLIAVPTAALAAPASTEFKVAGIEIAATSTTGTFIGKAHGNDGDKGAWKAVIHHTVLSSLPAGITGGTFTMATVSPSLRTDFVAGNFTGGTIDLFKPVFGCTNQLFTVIGTLGGVATSTSTGGGGTFSVLLTHYRAPLFGRCVTYAATVAGIARFTYSPV